MLESTDTNALEIAIKKERLLLILQNKYSKISPSTSVHFAIPVRRLCVVRLSYLHVSLYSQVHPKCERAIRLVYPSFFCKLRSASNPTNNNLKKL